MAASPAKKITVADVIGVVLRDGKASQEEVALIRPIALEYQAAFLAGTTDTVAKSLLERLMGIVGKERVKNALRHLNQQQVAANAAAAAAAQQPADGAASAAGPMAPPADVAVAVSPAPPGQKHGIGTRSAEPRAKRARPDEPAQASALVATPAPQAGAGAASSAAAGATGKRSRKAASGADAGGGAEAPAPSGSLLADVNLDDEQARLLAPRPAAAYGTRSSQRAAASSALALPASTAQAGGAPGGPSAPAEERGAAVLGKWLGGVLQAEGLLPGRGPDASAASTPELAELAEVLEGGLRQHMRHLLCGMCDASQRRRETEATQAGLVRSDAPTGAQANALAPAVPAASGSVSAALKERVQLKDALYFLEAERRTSKSPILLWWRAVGSVRNRFPRQQQWRVPAPEPGAAAAAEQSLQMLGSCDAPSSIAAGPS